MVMQIIPGLFSALGTDRDELGHKCRTVKPYFKALLCVSHRTKRKPRSRGVFNEQEGNGCKR